MDDTHPGSLESESISITHFEELSAFEQALLTLLAISCEPAHTTLLVNCLKKLEIKNPRGNLPTATNVSHYLTKLQQGGFLDKERQCARELSETLCKRSVQQGHFGQWAKIIQAEAPVSYFYGKWTTRCWRAMREIRIGIYTQQFELIDDASDFLDNQCGELVGPLPATVRVMCHPFDISWLRSLPPSFQFYLLADVLEYGQKSVTCYRDASDFLTGEKEYAHLQHDEQLPFKRLHFNELLFQGQLDKAQLLLTANSDFFSGTGAQGALLFLTGENGQAERAFARDLQFLRELSGSDDVAFFGLAGILFILSQIAASNREYQAVAEKISTALNLFQKSRESTSYSYLATVINTQLNERERPGGLELPEKKEDVLDLIFCAYSHYWLNNTIPPELGELAAHLQQRAEQQGYLLPATLLAELLTIAHPNDPEYSRRYRLIQERTGIIALKPLITPEEPWRRSLQALISATEEEQQQDTRMGWMLTFFDNDISITAREQKLLQDGTWSKGRPISPSRLYQSGQFDYLNSEDRQICAAIVKHHNPTTGSATYQFDLEKAIPAMIGHPHLFLAESPQTPVEFVEGEPELLVEAEGDNLHICFAQPITAEKINFHKETPTRIKVITINEQHRKVAQITGEHGITVPKAASEEVLTAIGNISSFMTVHSAIAADRRSQRGNIEFVEADSTIYMHLIPYGTGFRLEMFVKPFPGGNHYLKPGQGVENIMAEVDGVRLQTKRNLGEEEDRAREVEELCPVLDLAIDLEQENEREWHLHDPDDCLQALMELQAIRDQVRIEWPEGEKLAISQQVNGENLNLKIRTNRQNWFTMSGQLELEQGKIIELKELLRKVGEGQSRFVEIGDGQFIALTQEFRKRLDDLKLFSQNSENGDEELLIHPLAAIQLEKLIDRSKTEADEGWRQQLQRIAETRNFTPTVPSTLQAELRHYQQEGFEWLARLAHWGVGGCLADDMGLGKTLQSLAVVLELADKGPSLVIAPTSVSTNWQTEVQRFAPTINLCFLGPKERKETVQHLGKFDLLVTTYTLLQQESELLSSIKWQAVILDEAQAIKNSATKRSQAAMSLQARFKLITTGTPIENHLGELWNLFHFINPGLLGSLSHFNSNFAIPIERYADRDARMRLKKLIRPFLLRRIKSQVLEELPSRTEVTLDVEMSLDERHFYEALRQNAIEILESNRERQGHHLQILTEITRLRQACCNTRLIDTGSTIESSKLRVFAEVISELLESNHKALIFSQFIGHLSIIREYLDQQKIHYQYLDGNTSSRQRKIRVDAFQAGEGDLFLISLKAGGLGLNLTAADYVLHMDPWWNPAIEDQASDRAYRIGQTRPVTIYRLVCKNTIEEKIVKLHQEKRELAGSLLEGTDSSARISSEELLNLIKAG